MTPGQRRRRLIRLLATAALRAARKSDNCGQTTEKDSSAGSSGSPTKMSDREQAR